MGQSETQSAFISLVAAQLALCKSQDKGFVMRSVSPEAEDSDDHRGHNDDEASQGRADDKRQLVLHGSLWIICER